MRIVVTGASGNVGSALLRRLLPAGHEVVGVVRRPPAVDAAGDVRWVRADLSRPDSAGPLAQAVAGADAVVHLAWGFQPTHDEAYLHALGVGGTGRVLAAAAAAGVGHLVHTSSVGAYARKATDDPVEESWPTTGIPTSAYSRHKVAAERMLDAHEARDELPLVARLRPGLVGQRPAGSALLRYGLPGYVPAAALRLLPVLPLDPGFVIPMVHADDVADAAARILERGATGAFNLAAPTPVGRDDVARALGAHPVDLPARALRAVVDLTWRARLQPLDAGWLDLAFAVPLLDTRRARRELDWQPVHTGPEVFAQVVAAMASAASGPTPALRPRTVREQLTRALRYGPVDRRPFA